MTVTAACGTTATVPQAVTEMVAAYARARAASGAAPSDGNPESGERGLEAAAACDGDLSASNRADRVLPEGTRQGGSRGR